MAKQQAISCGIFSPGSANINYIYGPWESIDKAKEVLTQTYSSFDQGVDIPVGTTVAVYDDGSQQTVTEYWWSSNNLVLKNFESNKLELRLFDKVGVQVHEVFLYDDKVNSPEFLMPERYDCSTNSESDLGYIEYSIDGGSFVTYNPNDVLTKYINTSNIHKSIIFRWIGEQDDIIATLNVPVHGLSNCIQYFYAYNDTTETPPEYTNNSSTYNTFSWTPNPYGKTHWSKEQTGTTLKNNVEWVIKRERFDGVWKSFEGPFIGNRWGQDGITSNIKQVLYIYLNDSSKEAQQVINDALSDLQSSNPNDKNTYIAQDWNQSQIIENCPTQSDGQKYFIITDYNGNSIKLYPTFIDFTSEDLNEIFKYCYCTERVRDIEDDEVIYGKWTDIQFFRNYAIDGYDGSGVEYIYYKTSQSELPNEAKAALKELNDEYCVNSEGELGREIFTGGVHEYKGWTDDPQGVSAQSEYEFICKRSIKPSPLGSIYSKFSNPVLWASFGKEGPDGPGLEYIYKLTNIKENPEAPDIDNIDSSEFQKADYVPDGWDDDPLEVSIDNPYLWMSQRKGSDGYWSEFSKPVLWNEYSATYEIRLSNDNCTIPASISGAYTLEAAKAATLTNIELFCGINKITENVSFEGPKDSAGNQLYSFEEGKAWLNSNKLVIDNLYNSEFIAKYNGNSVATKVQSLHLNRGKLSYKLQILPNSRIWYGGSRYSVTQFSFNLQSIDELGQITNINITDTTEYSLKYQLSSESILKDLDYIPQGVTSQFIISEGEKDCIYVSIYKNNSLLDVEQIDCVDYSSIKGEDASSLTFEYNETISIPRNKQSDVDFITQYTKHYIRAWVGLKEYEITDIKYSSTYFDALLTGSGPTVKCFQEGNIWYSQIESELLGNAWIVYEITLQIDENTTQTYEIIQNILISDQNIVYNISLGTQILTVNATGLSINSIPFQITSSSTNSFNYILKVLVNNDPFEELNYTPLDGYSGVLQLNSDELKEQILNKYLETSTIAVQLFVEDKLQDTDSAAVIWEPQFEGHNYTVDFSNPYVQLLSNMNTDHLKNFSLNTIAVQSGDTKVPYDPQSGSNYPYYTLDLPDGMDVSLNQDDYADTWLTELPSLSSDSKHITVQIHESATKVIPFVKTQSIQIVEHVIYSLKSSPTTVVGNPDVGGSFYYNPTVTKLENNVQENVQISGNIQIKYKTDNESEYRDFSSGTEISYGAQDSRIDVQLLVNNEVRDLDSITIARNGRNGEDGTLIKYIFGRITNSTDRVDASELASSTITRENLKTLQLPLTETINLTEPTRTYTIEWTDSAQGVTEDQPQEFYSYSTGPDLNNLDNFISPKLWSAFGVKGKDGDGISYIFTTSNIQFSFSSESDDWKFAEGNTYYNHKNEKISDEDAQDNQDDNYVLDGWFDEIPDLTSSYPLLYMSYRKKQSGVWGNFSKPVLWNKYNNTLELFIDNDTIVIDDNSTSDTIQKLSTTKCTAFYQGSEYTPSSGLTTNIDESLASYFTLRGDYSGYYLSLNNNVSLEPTSGQITYILQKGTDVVTRKQTIYVQDFSVGEGYKLMLSPSVIPCVYENGKYSWNGTYINLDVTKINGQNSTSVPLDDNLYVTVDGTRITSPYQVVAQSNVDHNTPIVFKLHKKYQENGVDKSAVVDSQTLSFSTKGADGKTPFIINLEPDTDSILVNEHIKDDQTCKTTIQVYYGNDSVTDFTIDVPDDLGLGDIEASIPILDNKSVSVKIPPSEFWRKSISVPITVSGNYNGAELNRTVYYKIVFINGFIKYELYPSSATIHVDHTGSIIGDSFVMEIRKLDKGVSIINSYSDLQGTGLVITRSIGDSQSEQVNSLGAQELGSSITASNISYTLKHNENIIDEEHIPVIKDGNPGESRFVLDLTDNTDSVLINELSSDTQECTTEVLLYYGNSQVEDLTNFTINTELTKYSGINCKINKPKITVTIPKNTTINESSLFYPIRVTGNYNGEYVDLTVNYKILLLNDPIKYELAPSSSVIHVNPNDTSIMDSFIMSINKYESGTVKNIISTSDLSSDISLWRKIDDVENWSSGSLGDQTSDISVNNSILKYRLVKGSDVNGAKLDEETIYIVRDGEKGDTGPTGPEGPTGPSGKNAALYLRGAWSSSEIYNANYLNSDGTTYYTDVVSYENNGTVEFYQAKQYSFNEAPTPTSEYWLKIVGSDVVLTSNLIIYGNNNGQISGGFVDTGSQYSPNDIVIWSGGQGYDTETSVSTATFSVTRDGVLRAKEGLFEGMYSSKTSIINDTNIDCSGNIDLKNIAHSGSTSDSFIIIPRLINVKSLTESMWFNIGEDTYNYPKGDKQIGTIKTDDTYPMYENGKLTLKLPSGCIFPPASKIHTEYQWGALRQYFLTSAANIDWFDSAEVGQDAIPTGEYSANYHYLSAINGSSVNDDISAVSDIVLEKHRKYQMQEFINALPYVGKKLTLINFKGILHGILTSETITEHKEGRFSPSLAKYLAFGYDDKTNFTDSTNESIITVECKIGALGNITAADISLAGAYYIYWEKVFSDKSSVYYDIPEELPVFTIPVRN